MSEYSIDNVPAELKTYSVAEVSSMFGIKKDKVYEYLRSGKLAHVKMGKTRIRHQTLVKFLDELESTEYWESGVMC